jgi:PIN domain nuclease of toxin-antitoxin system
MKMTDTKLLDSSIWIAYLFEGKFIELVEKTQTYLSALSVFEIKRKLMQKQISPKTIQEKIRYIKERTIIVPVTLKIAEKSVEISIKNKMPMADSIIYTTGEENHAEIYTLDNHFRNLEHATIPD